MADIVAALDAREAAVRPDRTRHLAFGDVAAVWGMLHRLGVVAVVDEVVGARREDAGASVGTYPALAALGRCSRNGGAPPPPARRMLTETTPTQDRLAEIFELHRWAPLT